MPRRITKEGRELRPTQIRAWRQYRNLSQDRLVERMREKVVTFSKASLSRIERAEQPYTQDVLEALADCLRCEPVDLLIRDPREDNPWSIWATLKPTQRKQAIKMMRVLAGEDPDDLAKAS